MKIFLSILVLCLSVSAFAQQVTNGISGKITDEATEARLPYAMVTLIREGDKGQRKSMADSEGNYHFGRVIPGTYTLKVEYENHKTFVIEGVEIAEDHVTQLDFALEPHRSDPREWEPVAVPTED